MNKYMVFIAVIVLIILCALIMSGCSISDTNEVETNDPFTVVGYSDHGKIVVDTDTKVMYWLSDGTHSKGNLFLLVNQDGTPKIWEG